MFHEYGMKYTEALIDENFLGVSLSKQLTDWFSCMGEDIYLNRTPYGSACTTFLSYLRAKEEQYEELMEQGLIVVGFGLNGDMLVVNAANDHVGYVFHDDFAEEAYDEPSDIHVELPINLFSFAELALSGKVYPMDGSMAEAYLSEHRDGKI